MASGGTDDNAHLYKNVQELKYRLELTETSLNSLDALECDEKGVRFTPGHVNMDQGPALTMDDLSTEDRSTRQVTPVTSPTPQRKSASRSSSETSNILDDPCRTLFQHTASSSLRTTSSSSSVALSACYDAEGLRMKLHELRERNTQLVCQNNRLHNEVETACAKLQEANCLLSVSQKKTEEYKSAIPQLEDKLINVRAENESLEKTLRGTEDRLETTQRQLGETDSGLRAQKRNTKCLETQLADTLRDKKRLEKDLGTAVRNAEELQSCYEELRRKTKDKLKFYKIGHDELMEKLEQAKLEKTRHLDDIAILQTKTDRLKGELSHQKLDSFCQAELEKENNRLKADVDRHKKKIVELQAMLTDTEMMRTENCQLRNIVEDQKQQLDTCHTQLCCSKKQLAQLELAAACAGTQSPYDSGFGYSGDRSNLDGSYLDTLTSAGRKSPPLDAARVCELKSRLAQRECELEELRKQLTCDPCPSLSCLSHLPCQCQCGDSGNSIIDCWRRELLSVLAKNREGERKLAELEEMVRRFESERAMHTTELLSQGKRLEEFIHANSSLENKLTQRNQLVSRLEQEVDEKENSIAVNERELRKRSLQITAIERQLDQKANEVSQQVALVSELEEAVQRKVVEAQKVRQELQERVNETKALSEQLDSVKQWSKEQQRTLETQVDKMAQQLETKANRMAEYEHKVEQLSHDLSTKEANLVHTKQQLQEHMEQSQNQIRSLETKVDDATKTVKNLEGAMAVCKEEIGLYMDQITDMKERHETEINEKVDALTNMQLDRAQLEQTVNDREEQLMSLETTLEQRQQMLTESNKRINAVEEEHARTQKQMEDLEHVMVEKEELYKENLEDVENRVQAISADLEQTTKAMQIATVTNRELEQEKRVLSARVEDITDELHTEQKEKAEHIAQNQHLVSELSTTKQTLEEKKEQVSDMRREITEKIEQLDEKTRHIENVTQKLTKIEDELDKVSLQGVEMQNELTEKDAELQRKAQLVEEMKEEMREKMEDLKTKAKEIDDLTISLNHRQTELQQRAAQVLQLEMDFVEYKTDTEQRIAEMESTIFKKNIENEQKTVQISELEGCRHKLQNELEECRSQYVHLEHINCEQRSNLECQAVRITRLEQLLDDEKRKVTETLNANNCCDTELKNIREHHQKMMAAMSETQQDLTAVQQENDRLAHDLEQAAAVAQAKQAECCHLRECMEVLKSQEAQHDSQVGANIRQLHHQMAAQEDHYKKEVAALRASVTEKEILVVELQTKLKQLTADHDSVKTDFEQLQKQYNGLRDDSHNALVGKEADIARLEARIAGYERATFGHAHTPVTMTTQVSHQSLRQHATMPPPSPALPPQTPESPLLTHPHPTQHYHPATPPQHHTPPPHHHTPPPHHHTPPPHHHTPTQHYHPATPPQYHTSPQHHTPPQHHHTPPPHHHTPTQHYHPATPPQLHTPPPHHHSPTHVGFSHSDIDLHLQNVATSNNHHHHHAVRQSTSELSHAMFPSTQSLGSAGNRTDITSFSRLVTESELSFNLSSPPSSPTHLHYVGMKKSLSDTRLHEELHRRVALPVASSAPLRRDRSSNRCNHATTPDAHAYSPSTASLDNSDPNCLQNMLKEINREFDVRSVATSSNAASPPSGGNGPSLSPGAHSTNKLTLQLSPRVATWSPVNTGQMSPRPALLSQFSSPVSPIAASSPVPRSPTLSNDSAISDIRPPSGLRPKSSSQTTQSKPSRQTSASQDRLKPALKKKSSMKTSGRAGDPPKAGGTLTGSRRTRAPSGGKQRAQPSRDRSRDGDSFASPHVTTAVSYYTSYDDLHAAADTSGDTHGSYSASLSCSTAPTVVTTARDRRGSATLSASTGSGQTLESSGTDNTVGADTTDHEWSPERCLSRLAERRAALQKRQQQLNVHLHEIEGAMLSPRPPH